MRTAILRKACTAIASRATWSGHFKDGSLTYETAIFSERGEFRLLSYHLTQEGRRFLIRWKFGSTWRSRRYESLDRG